MYTDDSFTAKASGLKFLLGRPGFRVFWLGPSHHPRPLFRWQLQAGVKLSMRGNAGQSSRRLVNLPWSSTNLTVLESSRQQISQKDVIRPWLCPGYSFLYPPRNNCLILDTFKIGVKKSSKFEFGQRSQKMLSSIHRITRLYFCLYFGDFAELACIQKCFRCCTIQK